MHLLHILWTGDIGGAERAIFQLAQAQIQQTNYKIAVAFGQKRGHYAERLAEIGVEVVDLHLSSAHDVLALPHLRQILMAYDAHHFHVAEPLIMLGSILTPGKQRYYTYRAGYHERRGKRALRFRIIGWLVRHWFTAVSANTAFGATVAENLLHLPPESVLVTYNGLNFDLFNPSLNCQQSRHRLNVLEDTFVIGTVSNLKSWKRTDWLLHAAASLSNKNWQLVIVGDGPMRAQLEQLAVDLNISRQVIFTGQQKQVADWLIGFDAFVLPSSSGESFGNAAVEAMALGLPTIVCSDGGGLTEHIILEQTGWIVDGIEGITNCLNKLAQEKEQAGQIGMKAKLAIREKYSIEKMLHAYNQLYTPKGKS